MLNERKYVEHIVAVAVIEAKRLRRSAATVLISLAIVTIFVVSAGRMITSTVPAEVSTYALSIGTDAAPVAGFWYTLVDLSGTLLAGGAVLVSWDVVVRDRVHAAGVIFDWLPLSTTTVFAGKYLVTAVLVGLICLVGTLSSGLLFVLFTPEPPILSHLIAGGVTTVYLLGIASMAVLVSTVSKTRLEAMGGSFALYLLLLFGWIVLVPRGIPLVFHPSFAYSVLVTAPFSELHPAVTTAEGGSSIVSVSLGVLTSYVIVPSCIGYAVSRRRVNAHV